MLVEKERKYMKQLWLLIVSSFCFSFLLAEELGLTPLVPQEEEMFSVDADEQEPEDEIGVRAPGLYYGKVSDNFITNVAFRKLFNLRFEKKLGYSNFDPAKVKRGDIVFVDNPRAFLHRVHPHIEHPYILVSHNHSQFKFIDEFVPYLDSAKIIAWFGVHPESTEPHPKFFPIPVGVTLFRDILHTHQKETNELLIKLRNKPKHGLLYMNFAEVRFPGERKSVKEMFENKSFCFYRKRRIPIRSFLNEMASYKFTLSPRGVGIDCFRTWEALLVGTIPIVKSSQLNRLYKDLPVVVINEWAEVTQEFLEKKYREITSKKYNIQKLYVEYWRNKIKLVQKNFLQQQT
jgi:hypothetical protein